MKSNAFAYYSDVPLTLLGLGLFLGVFLGVLWWTGLKMNQKKYQHLSTELLKDGE